MKYGNKGLAVAQLQLQLRRLDHYKGLIDARLGSNTAEAIKSAQRAYNLTVDGIAGKYTQRELKKRTKDAYFCLFLHCSATSEHPKQAHFDKKFIMELHTSKEKGKGWSRVGYSACIPRNGELQVLRPADEDDLISDWEFTFGIKNSSLLNRNSRHLCYIGGIAADFKTHKDTRTPEQLETMKEYVLEQLAQNPKLLVIGHNNVDRKGCPCFDVRDWLRSIGIPEYNIVQFTAYKALY